MCFPTTRKRSTYTCKAPSIPAILRRQHSANAAAIVCLSETKVCICHIITSLSLAAPQRAERSSRCVQTAPYVLSGERPLLCVPFLKRHKSSKCLLSAPQAAVPVLIMESESSVTTQSEAVANYVVIMRRRTHLMTGLAQGPDGVSAQVFWMNALPARLSQKAEGCAWFCFFLFCFFVCNGGFVPKFWGTGRKRSTLDKTQGEMWQKNLPKLLKCCPESRGFDVRRS